MIIKTDNKIKIKHTNNSFLIPSIGNNRSGKKFITGKLK